jgi:hypothetical protein
MNVVLALVWLTGIAVLVFLGWLGIGGYRAFGDERVPGLAELSRRGRLAIALRMFSTYCDKRGIAHPDVTASIDYLWHCVGAPGSLDEFDQWEMQIPPLLTTDWHLWSVGLESQLRSRGGSEQEFFRALFWTVRVLDSCPCEEEYELWSRNCVESLVALVARYDIEVPDIEPFLESRWSGSDGWGPPPTPEQLQAWRGG